MSRFPEYEQRAKELDQYAQERKRNPEPIAMKIESRVPSKWRFIDLETMDVWRWDVESNRYRREGIMGRLELLMVDKLQLGCDR